MDDSWEDVAGAISKSAASVDVSKIVKTLSNARWYASFSKEWNSAMSEAVTDLIALYEQLPNAMQVAIVAVPVLSTLYGILYSLAHPPEDYRQGMEPYVRGNYDPIQARAYYAKHPVLVMQRVLEMLRLSNTFLINLLIDKYILRQEEKKRPQRAKELLQLITKLGPTAIKVGQALSVRQDLIPIEYAEALATLQDQVPPFDSAKAKQILLAELGPEKLSHLKGLFDTKGPVASASIGQVYKAYIDDRQVAVKVQRPNVLSEIALDLYIVREFLPIYQFVIRSATNLQGLANEWGRGFIAELDYRKEAASTNRFTAEMKKRNLYAVCAPTVVMPYSTEQILVTDWVDGTRIDQSDSEDIPRLCSVALSAYLVMLLELQSLHCDPHPGTPVQHAARTVHSCTFALAFTHVFSHNTGNLLRTPDGRLCILDFGMTLDIDPNLQYSLLEYVAHLTSENYDDLPLDMVKLGFLKEEKLEFAQRSGVLEPLKYFLKQAGRGGGADAVRERIFSEYRAKYPGLSDDQLRLEMRAEMKVRKASRMVRKWRISGQ